MWCAFRHLLKHYYVLLYIALSGKFLNKNFVGISKEVMCLVVTVLFTLTSQKGQGESQFTKTLQWCFAFSNAI